MYKLTVILVLLSCMNRAGFSQVKPEDKKKPATNPNYRRAAELASSKPDSALYYYDQYRKSVSATDSLALTRDIPFYNIIGRAYIGNYFSDSTLYQQDLKKALFYHGKVLELDSMNSIANMNILAAYYNSGVRNITHGDYCKQREIIKQTDWNKPDSEIPSLAKLLECVKPEEYEKYGITPPFKAALPFALRLHRLNPANKNVLEALQGIYMALGDKKQAEAYKVKFEKLFGK
jgi:tetratricopeptide (TPR) repeat protein